MKKYHLKMRGKVYITKIKRDTGEIREVSGPHYNTMHDDGFELFMHLWTNSGAGASKHLTSPNAWLAVSDANPIVNFTGTNNPQFSAADDRGPATPVKSAPSHSIYWEWFDDSTTVRANQDNIELWYQDPTSGGVKVNNITVTEGTKPADENWHWRMEMELYSTDSDFDDAGIAALLDIITGDQSTHLDGGATWFRPFTAGDAGLGSTGQNPDAAPTIGTTPNTITFVTTVVDGDFNGVWSKMEVTRRATYNGANRLRYGGCTTAGGSCGTKIAGEEYEYTYVITVAQGS